MSTAVTLYGLEEQLVALLDTVDMVEDPEQQEAIAQEIIATHMACVEKRDRVAQFIVHCEGQQASIDAEVKRLQALKKAYSKTQEKVEEYIVRTIQGFGTDEKGKYRKLEGKTTVFSIRACPASVSVINESAVPAEFKTLTITVPATAWEELVDNVDLDERCKFLAAVKKTECAVDKKGVKSAIDDGLRRVAAEAQKNGISDRDEIQALVDAARPGMVPGADVATGRYSLIRK